MIDWRYVAFDSDQGPPWDDAVRFAHALAQLGANLSTAGFLAASDGQVSDHVERAAEDAVADRIAAWVMTWSPGNTHIMLALAAEIRAGKWRP